MRKVILSLAISFDGKIEGPYGEIDWLPFNEEAGTIISTFLKEIDTVLYGRVSYEAWGAYTPAADSSDFEKDIYNTLSKMTKYVFSTTTTSFACNPIVVSSNIKQAVENLKKQPGKNIWLYGGAKLVTTFMNLDLVDEYRIAIAPIVLGAGKPLFKDIDHRVPLKLAEVKSYPSGMLEVVYQRVTP